jgi:hypothetical protein
MHTYARLMRHQAAQCRPDASPKGEVKTFDTCVDCGVGVEIPTDKEGYAMYACRHRNGETLCQACFDMWANELEQPTVCPLCNESFMCTCDTWVAS